MNPDEAYRLHTDWARAIKRPGSAHADWFEHRMAEVCQPGRSGAARIRRIGEADTIEGLWRTGPLRDTSLIVGYERDSGARFGETDVFPEPSPEPSSPGTVKASDILVPEEVYAPLTVDELSAARTYYVTADMCSVIEHAAAALDDVDLMPRLPAWNGFVVLARPIELPMYRSAPQQVRAFAWNTWGEIQTSMGTTGQAAEVWTFASRKRDADMRMVQDARDMWPSKKAWQSDPDLLPCYVDWVVTGAPMPPLAESAAVGHAWVQAHQWYRENFTPMYGQDGEPVPPRPEDWKAHLAATQARRDQFLADAPADAHEAAYGYWQRYLAAFVLLLTQQITVANERPVAPATAKQAGQVSRARPSDVTVVDVRPRRNAGEPAVTGGSKRGPISVHHLVGGHWKWQPYGEARRLRRRIYVGVYDRGPKDQPLQVKPRVVRL